MRSCIAALCLVVWSVGHSVAFQPSESLQPLLDAASLMQSGQYQEAEELLLAWDSPHPQRQRLLLELTARRGDLSAAEHLARQLRSAYQSGRVSRPVDLAQAAYGVSFLDEWEEANQIYLRASQMEGAPRSLFIDWGNLYLKKYNPAEAELIFRDGIKAPEAEPALRRWSLADAYVGLFWALEEQYRLGSDEALSQAVALAPESLSVISGQVHSAIKTEDWEKAAPLIEKGLSLNPNYLPLLELNCAMAYLQENNAAFAKAKGHVLDINPRDANLFVLLGDLSVSQRRFQEAIEHYQSALDLNPREWLALAGKGINLLRLGRETEGISALEEAYKNDPYNLWTLNTLRLIDSFKRFERFETPHFNVRVHQKEGAALGPYAGELLERCISSLEQKYQHTIDQRITFEMYPDHEDFAVRTLGLPGLGAFGATFGNVVAMDSPSARPKGKFHWASTLWHEIAHVVTLSLTRGRVPRWFTEGLSMMEERLGGSGWGEPLNLSFLRAYESGKLLPLDQLDAGFLRPRFPEQVTLSYFQAGWVCEFMAKQFGMGRIREILIRFGEGDDTDSAFKAVLGIGVKEVDELFQQELKASLDPLKEPLTLPEEFSQDETSLRNALKENPENYFLNAALGSLLAEEGRTSEAEPFLREAIRIAPWIADESSPYAQLASILEQGEPTDAAIAHLRNWWARFPMLGENALKLARWMSTRGEQSEAVQILEEAMYVDPLNIGCHQLLGDLYLKENATKKAIREFMAMLSLNPTDTAGAHFRLARALYQDGDSAAAKRQVLLALEIAPGFEDAQTLLLEIVQP